jgi:tyrosyl-tRNA synthetase
MGKTEKGAVWLDKTKTSPYEFYQFWINADDLGVEDYLKIYTELDKQHVDVVTSKHNLNPADRHAQKILAFEVTKIVHGLNRANSVKKVSEVLFGTGSYADLEKNDFIELESELLVVDVSADTADLVEIIVSGNLAGSRTEARRFLDSNAIYVNGQQIPLDKSTLYDEDFLHGYAVIRRGKNTSCLVKKRK